MEFEHDSSSPSFHRRFRRSISVSRWFSSSDASSGSDDDSSNGAAQSSSSQPSSWIRDLSSMIPKIGAGSRRKSRRAGRTSEFRYDPASYALNFEDESARFGDFTPASFSARLAAASPAASVITELD